MDEEEDLELREIRKSFQTKTKLSANGSPNKKPNKIKVSNRYEIISMLENDVCKQAYRQIQKI